MAENRAKGIILLGWFLIITSVTGVLFNSYTIIYQPEFSATHAPAFRFNAELLQKISSAIWLLLSMFQFILGVNILKLKEKWRKITSYYFLSCIVFLVLSVLMFKDYLHGVRAEVGPIVWWGFLTYFITRPKVKEQFRK